MHAIKYKEIEEKIGSYFTDKKSMKEPMKVMPTIGTKKGVVGEVIANNYGDFTVQFQTEKGLITRQFRYSQIELVDDDGNPIIDDVLDMTGRPISVGQVICYSVSVGRNSHACEIGKVTKLTASGGVTAKPIIRNGTKIPESHWGRTERKGMNAEKVIGLPVDNTMVTVWLLSGFDVFKADQM